MRYIARALAVKPSGIRPSAPFTSPLARFDQRWNLASFAESPLTSEHTASPAPEDDGFVVRGAPPMDAAGIEPSPAARQPALVATAPAARAHTQATGAAFKETFQAP